VPNRPPRPGGPMAAGAPPCGATPGRWRRRGLETLQRLLGRHAPIGRSRRARPKAPPGPGGPGGRRAGLRAPRTLAGRRPGPCRDACPAQGQRPGGREPDALPAGDRYGDEALRRRFLDRPDVRRGPQLPQRLGRSVIVTPLRGPERTFGVIYLDAPLQPRSMDATRLPLVEAASGIAAELLGGGRRAAEPPVGPRQDRRPERPGQTRSAARPRRGEAARELERIVAAAAPQDVTVLITGETGTGKEMVAGASTCDRAAPEAPSSPSTAQPCRGS